MKYKIAVPLSVVGFCLALWCSAPAGSAQTASPAPGPKPVLTLLSKTDMTKVLDQELAIVYKEADAGLLEQIRDGLLSRGIQATVTDSEKAIAANPTPFVLVVKIDKIELGGKRPFGRTAKVKVGYSLQNKDRFDLVKRTHEETSVQKWQNCIKKISDDTAVNVASDIAKNSASQKADDTQVAPKQAPAGSSATETRLQELESLKAKGLITQQEYEAKRKEILKEL